jgi:hypothetical protein
MPDQKSLRVHPDAVMRPTQLLSVEPQIEAEPEDSGPKETVKVAQGRNIHAPIVPLQRVAVGFDTTTGQLIYRAQCRIYAAGETLELPASEARRLRETGHVFDPNKVLPAAEQHAQQFDRNDVTPGLVGTHSNVPGNGQAS